jgi:hypothetical protein
VCFLQFLEKQIEKRVAVALAVAVVGWEWCQNDRWEMAIILVVVALWLRYY